MSSAGEASSTYYSGMGPKGTCLYLSALKVKVKVQTSLSNKGTSSSLPLTLTKRTIKIANQAT